MWPEVAAQIGRVQQVGMGETISMEDMERSIRNGARLLWVVHDGPKVVAVIVLEVVRYPTGKTVVRIPLIAGSRFREWSERVQELLADFAVLVGAEGLEATVRPGLTRWLGSMGWSERATVMELPLGDEHG